ncbi:MAG: EamA-like transporter family protein [Deltaproteobacteria bacterium]|nr:EamA-like transporter family protein [Deltaproteobacteria bacterium]
MASEARRAPGQTRREDPQAAQRALILLALCGLFWSTGGVLIKYVQWNSGAIWSARCAIAAVALWLYRTCAQGRRPSLRGISRAEWQAAIAVAATTGLFIVANKLTTAANAILIQYSAPVWVALFGQWFLGERATRLDWVTIWLVLGGIALFFVDQITFDHAAGNLVALGSGVAFAFGAMTMRKVALSETPSLPVDPLRPLLLGNLVGAVVGAPFLAFGPWPDLTGWSALAALGLVQQAAAYLCYATAIRNATAIEVMLIPVIEPILSPLWVAIVFDEWPGGTALIGGAIVVGAVTMRGVVGRRR